MGRPGAGMGRAVTGEAGGRAAPCRVPDFLAGMPRAHLLRYGLGSRPSRAPPRAVGPRLPPAPPRGPPQRWEERVHARPPHAPTSAVRHLWYSPGRMAGR